MMASLPTPYYSHAGITIYHGDCRGILPHVTADVVVTDPPYGIFEHGGKWGRKADLQWDRKPADGVAGIVGDRPAVVWGGNYFGLPPSRGWLVWYKRDAVPSASQVELAWTSSDANSALFDWPIAATNAERIGHPTQKPLALMRWCIGFVPAGTILDPFMGSGTTLVAAKQLGRKAIGIEIEERYCEIAAKRLAQEVLPLEPEAPIPTQQTFL